MKYALLNCDEAKTGKEGEAAIVNIGSVAMRLAIHELLLDMGISADDIIRLNLSELNSYDGEYVIMPINMHWMQDVGNKRLLSMSHKIKPVFLSISLNDTSLNREQISFLKRYEPIGCRDDRTMITMMENGIDAYVFGCIAGSFRRRVINPEGRTDVVFSDVPYGVWKYVPEKMKKHIRFLQHEIPVTDIPAGKSVDEYTREIIEYYRTKVKLVVTSRFHGAIIPMAFGVPVIITNENYTFRFSWLRKIAPFYTRESFDKIDWNPSPVAFEKIQNRMIEIAKKRILWTKNKYELLCDQSYELENCSDQSWELIDYYDEALDYIREHWNTTDKIEYAFWGVNNNAEAIYQFISKRYPNAVLTKVFDVYRTIEFHGITSIKPAEVKEGETFPFVFVTTFVAGYCAEEFFGDRGVQPSDYFVCRRHYISEADLNYI